MRRGGERMRAILPVMVSLFLLLAAGESQFGRPAAEPVHLSRPWQSEQLHPGDRVRVRVWKKGAADVIVDAKQRLIHPLWGDADARMTTAELEKSLSALTGVPVVVQQLPR